MTIEEKVANLKERVKMLQSMIDIADDEISNDKIRERFLIDRYKELNSAYTEIKKHDPDYTNSKE